MSIGKKVGEKKHKYVYGIEINPESGGSTMFVCTHVHLVCVCCVMYDCVYSVRYYNTCVLCLFSWMPCCSHIFGILNSALLVPKEEQS